MKSLFCEVLNWGVLGGQSQAGNCLRGYGGSRGTVPLIPCCPDVGPFSDGSRLPALVLLLSFASLCVEGSVCRKVPSWFLESRSTSSRSKSLSPPPPLRAVPSTGRRWGFSRQTRLSCFPSRFSTLVPLFAEGREVWKI